MHGLPATTSAVPTQALSRYQNRLLQAKREAAQAQDKVATLEALTESAREEAARAAETLRELEHNPPRADQQAKRAQGSGSRYIPGRVAGALLDVSV